MAVGKVLPDARLALPGEIREAAGLKPGDMVSLQVIEPGVVEIRALTRLTLEESLSRYRIEGPVDEPADRERWQSEAARDVLGSTRAWRA